MKKVCHMTSAHETNDDRIFLKECQSLNNAGYDVYLVGKGDSKTSSGIKIVGIGEIPKGRFWRITRVSRRIFQKALSLDCDVYHLHDPELLSFGLKLKKKGKIVFFDSHEDVPAQIMDKEWIPKVLRGAISCIYKWYETHVVKQLDAVIVSTQYIAEQFKGRAKRIAIVYNYPILSDITFHDRPFSERESIVCYAGGISELRGEKVMIEAIKGIDAQLIMAGSHDPTDLIVFPEGGSFRYSGTLSREGVNDLYGKAVVGLVLLLPARNYVNSLPIKMFEYMASGIPFIASDFPFWKKIVNETNAGICVNVDDISMIRKQLTYLLENRDIAESMGRKGRIIVEQKYNWDITKNTLLNLYNELVK